MLVPLRFIGSMNHAVATVDVSYGRTLTQLCHRAASFEGRVDKHTNVT
jgi:hypothetical protein